MELTIVMRYWYTILCISREVRMEKKEYVSPAVTMVVIDAEQVVVASNCTGSWRQWDQISAADGVYICDDNEEFLTNDMTT